MKKRTLEYSLPRVKGEKESAQAKKKDYLPGRNSPQHAEEKTPESRNKWGNKTMITRPTSDPESGPLISSVKEGGPIHGFRS